MNPTILNYFQLPFGHKPNFHCFVYSVSWFQAWEQAIFLRLEGCGQSSDLFLVAFTLWMGMGWEMKQYLPGPFRTSPDLPGPIISLGCSIPFQNQSWNPNKDIGSRSCQKFTYYYEIVWKISNWPLNIYKKICTIC